MAHRIPTIFFAVCVATLWLPAAGLRLVGSGMAVTDPGLLHGPLVLVDPEDGIASVIHPKLFLLDDGTCLVPNLGLPRGRFRVFAEGRNDGPLATLDMNPNLMLYAVGGKGSGLGPLFEVLANSLPWGSLHTIGTYGRFFTPRAFSDLIRRCRNADGALILIEGRFEAANGGAIAIGETRITWPELSNLAPKSGFLFFPEEPGAEGMDYASLTNPFPQFGVLASPADAAGKTSGFFSNRVSMASNKTWQNLGDLWRHLGLPSAIEDRAVGSLHLRWSRFTPARREVQVLATPIYTEITNGGRASEVMRNGVTYLTREEFVIKKIQTGILSTTNILETPARWVDPAPGL